MRNPFGIGVADGRLEGTLIVFPSTFRGQTSPLGAIMKCLKDEGRTKNWRGLKKVSSSRNVQNLYNKTDRKTKVKRSPSIKSHKLEGIPVFVDRVGYSSSSDLLTVHPIPRRLMQVFTGHRSSRPGDKDPGQTGDVLRLSRLMIPESESSYTDRF